MPRVARLLVQDENSIYHIISRSALDNYPIGDYEKDYLVQIIQQYSRLFFVDVLDTVSWVRISYVELYIKNVMCSNSLC